MKPPADVNLRFWSQVAKGDTCWLWRGSKMPVSGYGWFFSHRIGGHSGKRVVMSAHRMAWELSHGPIPDGLLVCHRCDVRLCVRPEHLFLGTALDNATDASHKGRLVGRRNKSRAILPLDVVREIKRRLAAGERRSVIAKSIGTAHANVRDIDRGRTWKHA